MTYVRSLLVASGVALAFLVPTSALAAPAVDHNQGTWLDDYRDALGFVPSAPLTLNLRHDPAGRLVALANPAAPGQLTTTVIEPSSSSGWRDLALSFSASAAGDVTVSLIDAVTDEVYPLALAPSPDPSFTAVASLADVPATVARARVRVQLTRSVVAPTLQKLRVRWVPRSVLSLGLDAPAQVCTNGRIAYTVNVAVSFVNAQGLVVQIPLPAGVSPLDEPNAPSFAAASDGGTYSATGAIIGGVEVAPNSVYWLLGARTAGETFRLDAQLAIPNGIQHATTYTTHAVAAATNADRIATADRTTTTQSQPQPFIDKSVGGPFAIGGVRYADLGKTLSYTLTAGNYRVAPGACGENLRGAVVWDDVSDLLAASASGTLDGLSAGAVFVTDPAGVDVNGVHVPRNAVYWVVGDLAVRDQRAFSYAITLRNDGALTNADFIDNTAHIVSARHADNPVSGGGLVQASASVQVDVGVPWTPNSTYGLGNTLNGWTSVVGGGDDLPNYSVGYGQTAIFNAVTRNMGASVLNHAVMIQDVPAGTTFEAAWISVSPAATLRFATAPACATAAEGPHCPASIAAPPGYDRATGAFDPTLWSTTPPTDRSLVTFVAYELPRLASPFFPEAGASDIAVAAMRVLVGLPTDACPSVTLNQRGYFHTYAYTPQGAPAPLPYASNDFLDAEPLRVVPTVPDLSYFSATASASEVTAGGAVRITLDLPNRSTTGAPEDTALDVVVTVQLPRVTADGVPTWLPLTALDTGGGTVDFSEQPARLIVRYPKIFPAESKRITLDFRVPTGVVDRTGATLGARVDARDDVCGALSRTTAAGLTVRGKPALRVVKRADYAVVRPGSEVAYTLQVFNTGNSPSTGTWVVDRVPAGTTLLAARPTPGGTVWFSKQASPAALSTLAPFTPTAISGAFAQGVIQPDGRVTSPHGAATTFIAFRVDDPTLAPAQLTALAQPTATFTVRANDDLVSGTELRNEGAVLSSELIQSIGNRVSTVVSDLPSLDLRKTCPAVAGAGETALVVLDYLNDSTNVDAQVLVSDPLPAELELLAVDHQLNPLAAAHHPGATVPTTVQGPDGLSWDLTAALGAPLAPQEGGRLLLTVRVRDDVASGTLVTNTATGSAQNAVGGLTLTSTCTTLIENADLFLRAAVDNAAPRSGQVFTLSLQLSNEGGNDADDTALTAQLPAGLSYEPGSARVLTAGYDFVPEREPVDVGGLLSWRTSLDNALTAAGDAPGHLEGRSDDLVITLQVRVDDGVPPGTALTTCVAAAAATLEDANYPNDACVTVTTPLPDPYVRKKAPALVQPDAVVSYELVYGNLNNEDARHLVLIDALPDGPVPAANGAIDVTLLEVQTARGEAIWYLAGTAGDPAPAFDPADPAAGGWTQDLDALAVVTHVAIVVGDLAAFEGPFSVRLDVRATDPASGLPPQAGASFRNCATLASLGAGATRDDDLANNVGCVTSRTPGIDLSAAASCSPSGALPGVAPGDVVTVTVTLVNSGTVDAHGLRVEPLLPPGATVVGDDAGEVTVTTDAGLPASVINAAGDPVGTAVAWTRVADGWLLGAAGPDTAPDAFRRVGLAPGTRTTLTLQVKVGAAVADDTAQAFGAAARTAYRFDWTGAPVEEITDNNAATCAVRAYRADVFVVKQVADETGDPTLAEAGDRLAYTVEYGNAGHFAASDTLIQDALPPGAELVVGSLENLFGDEVVVEYDDGSLAWLYQPVGAAGDTDPSVTAFRVRWRNPLRAPANSIFAQSSAEELAQDLLVGVVVDPARGGASVDLSAAAAACQAVQCNVSYLEQCYDGLTWEEGSCCVTCVQAQNCWQSTNCEGYGYQCASNSCETCTAATAPTDWSTLRDSCADGTNALLDAYEACLATGDLVSCAGLQPGADAWSDCLPRACPDFPTDSCEWSGWFSTSQSLWDLLRGAYSRCLAAVGDGEQARCAGLEPWHGFAACRADQLLAFCPAADAPACAIRNFASACDNTFFSLASYFEPRCEELFGALRCAPLRIADVCAACLDDADRCADPVDAHCSWYTRANTCTNHGWGKNSYFQSCLRSHLDAPERCAWLAPTEDCSSCLTACPSADNVCVMDAWNDVADDSDYRAFSNWKDCASAVGAERLAVCDGLRHAGSVVGDCVESACPGPEGSAQAWDRFGDWQYDFTWYTSWYRECLNADYGSVAACAWLEPSWHGFDRCLAQGARWDAGAPCAVDTWSNEAQSFAYNIGNYFRECVAEVGAVEWAHCAGLLARAPADAGFAATCAAVDNPVERSGLALRCSNDHAYVAAYAFTTCLDAMVKNAPVGEDSAVTVARAEETCASVVAGPVCLGCLEGALPTGPEARSLQIGLCEEVAEDIRYGTLSNCLWRVNELVNAGYDLDSAALCSGVMEGVPACAEAFEDQETGRIVSPRIPADPEEAVLSWDRLVATVAESPGNHIRFTVTDADTGEPLPGLIDVRPDDTGVISLAGVDPTEHGALEVTGRFFGGPESCAVRLIPPGTYGSSVYNWNREGYVLGLASGSGASVVFVWTVRGGLVVLPAQAGSAYQIGAKGHVPTTHNDAGVSHAGVYVPDADPPTAYTHHLLEPTSESCTAARTNALGWVSGSCGGPPAEPVLWIPSAPYATDHVRISLASEAGATAQAEGDELSDGGFIAGHLLRDGATEPVVWTWNGDFPPTLALSRLPLPNGPAGVDAADVRVWDAHGEFIHGDYDTGAGWDTLLWWRDGAGGWHVADLTPFLPEGNGYLAVYQPNLHGDLLYTDTQGGDRRVFYVRRTGPDTWRSELVAAVPNDSFSDVGLNDHGDVMIAWRGAYNAVHFKILRADGRVISPPAFIDPSDYKLGNDLVVAGSDASGNAAVWSHCDDYGKPYLDDWTVVYATDKNPSFSFDVAVADACHTALTNTVNVRTTTPEITTENNASTVTTPVNTADLQVSVAVDQAAVLVDDNVTYTVHWENLGPGTARDVALNWTLPGAEPATAPLGDLPPGAAGDLAVSVIVDPARWSPDDVLAASAELVSPTIDCDPSNDGAAATAVVGGFPNLWVAVTGPAQLVPLGHGVFTVRYGNDGNVAIDGVTVHAALPAGATLVDGGAATLDGGVLTWTVADLAPGATAELVFTVAAPDCDAIGAVLTVEVDVTAASTLLESASTDNTALAAAAVVGYPGALAVLPAVSRATLESGERLITTLHFANPGAAAVGDVVLTATLPAGTTLVAGSAPDAALADGRLSWSLGRLQAGARGSVAFQADVSAAAGTTVGGTALTLVGAGACPVAALLPTSAVTAPGLHVVTAVDRALVCGARGDTLSWSVTVTNTSDAALDNVVVTDALPATLAYLPGSISGPGASDAAAPVLVWSLPTLPAGTGLTLGFRTSAPASNGLWVSHGARVSLGGAPSVPATAAIVTSDCNAALTVDKAWDAACALDDRDYTLTLRYRNVGATALTAVRVRDLLPPGVVPADGQAAAIDVTVASLAPHASGEITRAVRFAAGLAPGTLLANQASATALGGAWTTTNTVYAVALGCDDANPCTADGCAPALGCVHVDEPPTLGCDDGDACTQRDHCLAGACVGTDPVVCEASDPCHVVGACDPASGVCSDPNALDETPCVPELVACTVTAACQTGVCTTVVPVDCDDDNVCTADGCDPATGCTHPPVEAGADCDDGDACTQADACAEGVCVGADPVVCLALDGCHVAGLCDTATGVCTDPQAPDGTPCSDGALCTLEDLCQAGACTGTPRVCAAPNACQLAGSCVPETGACDYPEKPGDQPLPITLVDLGGLGGDFAEATAINASGVVVGAATTAGGQKHAVRWAAGALTDLTPTALEAGAVAINDAGLVVGTRQTAADAAPEAWLDDGGVLTVLWPVAALGDRPWLNANGQIAGSGRDAAGAAAAFVRSAAGVVTTLALPTGATEPEVRGLGAGGHVIGAMTVGGARHGFLAAPGAAGVDLGVVRLVAVAADGGVVGSGAAGGFFRNAAGVETVIGAGFEPTAMSDDGVVVGTAPSGLGPVHAWRWSAADGLADLGALGGDAWPVAVSASGFVAGSSEDASGVRHVFLWSAARGLEDLGTLVSGEASYALGLNVHGQVVGGGGGAFVSDAPEAACVLCDNDHQAPALICPVALAVAECVGAETPLALGAPFASDVCGPVTVTGAAPAAYPLGNTDVSWEASDAAGNGASCTATVRVVDTTAPALTCPEALEVPTTGQQCGAETTLGVSATDACAATSAVTVTTDAPALLPIGETTVTASATDPAGNAATCTFPVRVVDATALTLSCPDDRTIDLAADRCTWAETLTAVVASACDPEVEALVDERSFEVGTTEVGFTAEGREGEALTCATTVTVRDVTAPTVACNAPVALPYEALPLMAVGVAQDACGTAPRVEDVVCEAVDAAGAALTLTAADCGVSVAGDTLSVAATLPQAFTVRWVVRASDPSGNADELACAVVVAAPESTDSDDLVATGGGGCHGGGEGAPFGLALALLLGAVAFRQARRRR